MEQSFIEKQFPVSKISKESYKERKAGASQTLTGLGKWWGRKPLVLARAAIIGCLMPASDNPEKDQEIFLRIMSMDEEGLMLRKEKNLNTQQMYDAIISNKVLKKQYAKYFDSKDGKPVLTKSAPKAEIEMAAFKSLGYDAKIALCKRPENLDNISEHSWAEINNHLDTSAHSLPELIEQLSIKRYGHTITVGDCFCGGGSIPFEAARIGCNAYGSDLNPVAGLLTWAGVNLCGTSREQFDKIKDFQTRVFDTVNKRFTDLGIEENELGERAISYLYCVEAKCPDCGAMVPIAPSWVIGTKSKSIVKWINNSLSFEPKVVMGASDEDIKNAAKGFMQGNNLCCPCCGKTNPISTVRNDRISSDGSTVSGLRAWEQTDFISRDDDIYHERLYAIWYKRKDGSRYYREPNDRDIENERKVIDMLSANFDEWQAKGIIPSLPIESGYNTDQIIRERGWMYWHQLFNPRQLLAEAFLGEEIIKETDKTLLVAGILGRHKLADWNSKLSIWCNDDCHPSKNTFYNQALNTLFNYGVRSFSEARAIWTIDFVNESINTAGTFISLIDARNVSENMDVVITDPPYADAVNYHELTEFFLAWDKELIPKVFPEWYTDSKRILAVRGDEHFSQTMIDIYTNLANHMPDNGMQVVMFTHSDPAVWAQLALIMWKAGLTVTAAWNISTETDSGGLKGGNYVKGTVLLVLRKQTSDEEAFLDELTADIKTEVKRQIEYMQKLDDKEDPNFSDPDYVLAAYAASLKVLTSYREIGEIDLDYELNLAINNPTKSEVVKLIERAKKIAYDFIIPTDFDNYLWRELAPAERFYIKGLEAEKHGNYQVSTYQEYARGFGLSSYGQLMASEKANTARLKTPVEFAMKSINEIPEFEASILRIVLAAIYIAIKENENPQMGLWHLKTTVPNYWDRRDMLKQLLSYLMECKDIDTMPHWKVCGEMAYHINTLVQNDRI